MLEFKKCLLNLDTLLTYHFQLLILLLISIIAIQIKSGDCIIPEASQEGALHSFKNYGDVTIFHYNIPKEVLRATWQFAAFMDSDKCSRRKVNIFLKWGSYPIITESNATYPDHMYIENNRTVQVSTLTSFEPKSNTIVPVYSPEPGDWFVGAYLSHWDEEVHQKGLGHECHYSLGSVAVWSETTSIQNIPLGYQKKIRTSETISYYKVFIPSGTWNFQIDIWGCNTTVKKNLRLHHGPCIKNLALKARSLPYYNHTNPSSVGRLTTMDTFTFSEQFPYEDSWYYLMVVSNSAITFNIKVTVFDCPIRTMEEVYLGLFMNKSSYSLPDKLNTDYLKNQMQWYPINQSDIEQNSILHSKKQFGNLDDSCIPRYKLVRIQNSEMFSRDYLLRGREWLTSWLALTDRYPVITQFDILPLVDIGGTLHIDINLEIDKNLYEEEVSVSFCISRGRVPKQLTEHIICDNNQTMRLSTIHSQRSSLLIPYPEPDTWYIAFQANCLINGIPVRCKMEEILMSLNIKLQACVFKGSDSCGQYGVCQEIQKGPLCYTACECFGGRQGWGCTDTTNAISELSILLSTLTLTLSNLFFIPAIYLATKRKLYTEGFIYFCAMLFSALYHACDQQTTTHCIAKYEVLQYCDFFSGILAFWVTFIAISDIPVQYVSFSHMFGAIIVTFSVESDKTGLLSILIPLIIGILISLCSYCYYCLKLKKISRPRRFIKLIIGLSLAGLGILLFSIVETESNYKYVHSAWHVIIAISLIFLLPPEKEDKILSEKTSNETSADDSVFNIDGNQHDNHLITEIN